MSHESRQPWLDRFAKVLNREALALARAPFTNAVQLQIVLYLLARTRGTGRIESGDMEGAGWNEWQDVRATYGRAAVPLYRSTIAQGIGRADKHTCRELRRLIAAGIVVEHEAGHKSKKAVLSVDLDPMHWKPSYLRYSGPNQTPKRCDEQDDAGPNQTPNMGPNQTPKLLLSGPTPVPISRDLKRETLRASSSEEETSKSRRAKRRDSDECDNDPAAGITTQELCALARDLSGLFANRAQEELTDDHH